MLRVLDLGLRRLSVVEALPFAEGEATSVGRAVAEAEPATLAVDVSLPGLLRLRDALKDKRAWETDFAGELLLDAARARYAVESVHPALEAVRHARAKNVTVVPLIEAATDPGPFTRRRLRSEVESFLERSPDSKSEDPRAFARAFDDALRGVPRFATESAAAEADAAKRLSDLLFREEAPRLVAVLTFPRSERILRKLVESRPRSLNDPTVEEVAKVERGKGGG